MIQTEQAIEQIRELKNHLNAQKAFLFGSVARRTQNDSSDVDVIFVQETDKRFHHRIGDVLDISPIDFPIEPLIYTPDEFERMKSTPTLKHMLQGSIEV